MCGRRLARAAGGPGDPAGGAATKRYEFADPALESLSDAQKQRLRMGPANAKRVTAKLREIQSALGASS